MPRDVGVKLTWDHVDAIRSRWSDGASQKVLAQEYGVDNSVISRIVQGKSWTVRSLRYRAAGECAEILLTQGRVAIVDIDDLPLVSRHRWHVHKSEWTDYAETHVPHPTGIKTAKLEMHRLILGLELGDSRFGDHVDGNGLNNRRSNLRIASTRQNNCNRAPNRSNTSGYKGVSWSRGRRVYVANIMVGGKQCHLGRFSDPVEAARVYDAAARERFGEFAWLNFPAVPA